MDDNRSNGFEPENYQGIDYQDNSYPSDPQDVGYQQDYQNYDPNQYGYAPVEPPQQPSGSPGFGIASLILGILSIPCCCVWYISGLFSILAIVFGIIAIKKKAGKGMGIAGIITGAIGLIFAIILMIFAVGLISDPSFMQKYWDMIYDTYEEQGMDPSIFDEYRYGA